MSGAQTYQGRGVSSLETQGQQGCTASCQVNRSGNAGPRPACCGLTLLSGSVVGTVLSPAPHCFPTACFPPTPQLSRAEQPGTDSGLHPPTVKHLIPKSLYCSLILLHGLGFRSQAQGVCQIHHLLPSERRWKTSERIPGERSKWLRSSWKGKTWI